MWNIIKIGKYKGKRYDYLDELLYDANTIYYDEKYNLKVSYTIDKEYYIECKGIYNYINHCSKCDTELGRYCESLKLTDSYGDLQKLIEDVVEYEEDKE